MSNGSFKAIITLIIQALQSEKLIVRFFLRHPVYRQTDRQTDRQAETVSLFDALYTWVKGY